MKLVDALDLVAKHYVSGCARYYGSQNPDPWIATHEAWERALLAVSEDWDARHALNESYAKKLVALADAYKAQQTGTPMPNVFEAAMLGDERRQKNASVHWRHCYQCARTKSLKIRTDAETKEPYLVCEECLRRSA